ncbi:MAG: hypothetical protein A3J94_04485 [Syntrophus sp. RIFOXYC2_FULL_54_9]|nr:MAG: hypothetical protein A3J94_04485 [Syntrophus sp. RIFOXYC2_FULL_54_9]
MKHVLSLILALSLFAVTGICSAQAASGPSIALPPAEVILNACKEMGVEAVGGGYVLSKMAKHVFINDLYDKGCDTTLARLPKEGYVAFVCATGARAGEMYFGIKNECKADTKRLFFLDTEVAYTPKGPVIK